MYGKSFFVTSFLILFIANGCWSTDNMQVLRDKERLLDHVRSECKKRMVDKVAAQQLIFFHHRKNLRYVGHQV